MVKLYVTKDKPSTKLTIPEIEKIRDSIEKMSFQEQIEVFKQFLATATPDEEQKKTSTS
jgi:hypothetical protein